MAKLFHSRIPHAFRLRLDELNCTVAGRELFSDFSAVIEAGQRIAIIGRNGAGKSSLLKLIERSAREHGFLVGFVPQLIADYQRLSGGQRFNKALSQALAGAPDLLLLDEPTNHLDHENRQSLLRKLESFDGALIVVTHDLLLLRGVMQRIWHLHDGKITVFDGLYEDYLREQSVRASQLRDRLKQLKHQQASAHERLMREQRRAAKSRAAGKLGVQNKKWDKLSAGLKVMQAEGAQGDRLKALASQRERLATELGDLYMPEQLVPNFMLTASRVSTSSGAVVTIKSADIGYVSSIEQNSHYCGDDDGGNDSDSNCDAGSSDKAGALGQRSVLRNLNLTVMAGQKVAITGRNGSGKSTLLKAIMRDPQIAVTGEWYLPKPSEIGFLDQHYATLKGDETPLEVIARHAPSLSYQEIREHLNRFLFRKNAEVELPCRQLSGGERARLSLAAIAANPPKLLLLDEVTNNLDLETYEHVVAVLAAYPGAAIIVSHDDEFLRRIGVLECQLPLL